MKNRALKLFSLILVVVMVVSFVPISSLAANVLCALGHDWGDPVITTKATCTTTGVKTYTCKRSGCGQTKTEEVAKDPNAHVKVTATRVEPTCDTYGKEAGEFCGNCNAVISGYANIAPTGHKSTTLEAKAATCTEDGNKAGTKCSVCDKTLTGGAVIPKTGHDWELYSKRPATCTSAGEQIDICKNCSLKSEVKVLEASHSFGSWKTVTAATCKAAGKMERTCTIAGCGVTETKAIEKLAHTIEILKATAPTCTEPGTTAGKRCKVCNVVIEGAVVIPAKGHTVVAVAGKAATCDKTGTSDSSYCSACSMILAEQVIIQVLGHNLVTDTSASKAPTCTTTGLDVKKCTNTGCTFVESKILPVVHDAKWTVITQVTCTTDGKQRGTCKKCGMDVIETIPATGHKVTNDSAWRVTKSATCTAEGTKSATCETCGKTAIKSIPALGHNEVVKTPAVAATCTAEGKTESKHCSRCALVTVEVQKIEKLPHTYKDWVVTTAATCQVAGLEKSTCTVCKTETTRVVEKLAHTEEVIPAIPATCKNDGATSGLKCSVCNAMIKEPVKVAKTDHDYSEYKVEIEPTCENTCIIKICCTMCGASNGEYVLSALGHKFKDWQTVVEPTCAKEGIAIRLCNVCDKVDYETISAVSHKDSNGDKKCDFGCGYEFENSAPEKEMNIFQKIAEWFKNIFDKLFGWL